MRLHRVLFGSKEHSHFHLPGYRATTAVLGIATEEKHCIFLVALFHLSAYKSFFCYGCIFTAEEVFEWSVGLA
jgi:hypothetical protein